MPLKESTALSTFVFWIFVVLFFGTGTAIAFLFMLFVANKGSLVSQIFEGSFVGGFGACAIFYFIGNLYRYLKGQQ